MEKPKIILWDIETSLMEVYKFDPLPEYISPDDIIHDWFIICISWKELGKKKVHCVDITQDEKRFKKNHRDDYYVVKTVREVLATADLIIHQNGDRFDLPKFNSRLIFHNLEPLPLIRTLDTKKEIKKIAKFTSNSLDYLAGLTGQGSKIDTRKELWRQCTQGDVKAIKKMARYNKYDVVLMEKLYSRFDKYFRNIPYLWRFFEDKTCPHCGSFNYIKKGFRETKTLIYQRYKCYSCGKYFRERKSEKRKSTFTSI